MEDNKSDKSQFDSELEDNEIEMRKKEIDRVEEENRVQDEPVNQKMEIYDFDYRIHLLRDFEEGLMENYLKEYKTKSDYYNFGLDEEKLAALVNKSIFMHYQKHLILSKTRGEPMKKNEFHNNPNNMAYFQHQYPGRGFHPGHYPNKK